MVETSRCEVGPKEGSTFEFTVALGPDVQDDSQDEARFAGRNLNVLVVEDNPASRGGRGRGVPRPALLTGVGGEAARLLAGGEDLT